MNILGLRADDKLLMTLSEPNIFYEDEDRTDDEFVVPPIPDIPIQLPPPSNTVDVTTFEDSTPSHTPLLDDLECLFSPISQPIEPQDDPLYDGSIIEKNCERGVCGLRNLGNTCFINAGIQCLMATAPIAVALAALPFTPQRTLTSTLADLTRKIWSGRYVTVGPALFKAGLGSYLPQFNDYRQHDCQEFLALLLDGLHEQLNTAGCKDIACQVEPREFGTADKEENAGVDKEEQSTSKCDDDNDISKCNETNLIRELVSEGMEIEKKSNIDKCTDTDFSGVPMEDNNEVQMEICDKQLNNKQTVSFLKEGISTVVNPVQRLAGLEDILKEAKTSNVNVLVQKEEANNEIRFDSDKYPKIDNLRRRGDGFSINSLQLDNNACGKRNSSLSSNAFSLDFNDGLDLKRVKLHSNSDDDDKNRRMELERQQKSPDLFLEKNERMECERKDDKEDDLLSDEIENSLLSTNFADITFDKTSEVEADKHWQKHLAANKSIVVNTFQGQFKSTVVCSSCKYKSVTYEPFMYLSVPLPNAMQRRLSMLRVTFVGESLKHPTEFLIDLNKYNAVSYLKNQILTKVGREVKGPILIAEVFDHHIAKFLDDHLLVRYLNDSNRSLYAFEVSTLLDKSTVEPIDDSKVEEYLAATACIICLEDKETDMKQHEDCSCLICDACIADSCSHYKQSTFDCPVCRKKIEPEVNLKPVESQPNSMPRMINVPIVFRVDTVGDGNNNQKTVELFGHPMLIRVPSTCSAEELRKELSSIIHYKEPYRLLLVDGQGLHCSRCFFNIHCRGCELPEELIFRNSDSIAVTFSKPVQVLPTTSSLGLLSSRPSALTLYDCIQAFSQSEVLDGNNPWFCPNCKQNRCATKTLSVWRYPDYLIVHLKRFVFHNHISTKIEEKVLFPLIGLSLATGSDYDLYACVCHIGGVAAGHYTTYTQHPYTKQWHYYNDSIVTKQSPMEDDYSNAYILFYKKSGLQPPPIDEVLKMIHGES